MPGIHRLGDVGTGHGCWPPRPIISGSSNVLVNGIPATKIGDSYAVHCCPPPCHGGSQASGNPTVLVNGSPVARQGDSISCGGSALACSGNVMA